MELIVHDFLAKDSTCVLPNVFVFLCEFLELTEKKTAEQEFEKESDDEPIASPVPMPFDIDQLPNVAPLRDHLETVTINRNVVGKLGKSTKVYRCMFVRRSSKLKLISENDFCMSPRRGSITQPSDDR